MAGALARVTGTITKVKIREGVAKATGKPYRMREAVVLVADEETATITLPDNQPEPGRGELVDWLVEVSVYGQSPAFRAVSDFPVADSKPVRAAS